MFTGWNPTGTEASLPINVRIFGAAGAQLTFKLFRSTQLRNLVKNVYPFEGQDLHIIFWYLQVTGC